MGINETGVLVKEDVNKEGVVPSGRCLSVLEEARAILGSLTPKEGVAAWQCLHTPEVDAELESLRQWRARSLGEGAAHVIP